MMEDLQDSQATEAQPETNEEPEERAEPEPETDRDEWAMDFRGTEAASLVEGAKQMQKPETQEPEEKPGQGGDEGHGLGRGRDGGERIPMDSALLETTVSNGGEMLFSGLTYATGQNMTLTEDERTELTKYATPVVKKRLPRKKKFLPETLLGIYLVNLMHSKFDVSEVI